MKFNFPSRILILIPGVLLSSPFAISQNQIQVFPAINTRQSPNIASFTVPYVMASSTVNVTCPAVAKGTLSGPLMNANNSGPLLSSGNLQPGGNLFVDNNVIVTVTPFVGPAGTATNVCVGGVMDDP